MRFAEELGQTYLGHIDHALLGYAADEGIRQGAASGGAVSALLIHLLATGRIDAALVTVLSCDNGRIECRCVLAKTPEEVLAARTSKYIDAPVVAQGRKLIAQFDGRVAVVGLPCHLEMFRRLGQRDAVLASRIRYTIALFCGHTWDRFLLDSVLRRNGVDQSQVTEFAFRKGLWRGRMTGRTADGGEFSFPFSRFSHYHNLNFFCLGRCLRCHDHTGYVSDFSAGDAWLREMKREPVKHSVIFSRNPPATALLKEMADGGQLVAKPIDAATVFRSQKRSLIYHYNVTARAGAARRYGLGIRDTVHAKVRWNDWLAARIILLNYALSHDPRRRDWVFRLPRPILLAYFLLLKFLQSF